MTIKHENNLVGSLMFIIFLMGSVGRYGYEALSSMLGKGNERDLVEMILIFPASIIMIGFLGWVFFDSSWLNLDDEDKEKEWRTSRWIKFSVLFILPVMKVFSMATWDSKEITLWGSEISRQIQDFAVITLAYISLCSSYSSGLGRLFQPFTVPRSRIYTDEKGQKFEVNFIGTTLSIFLIVWPAWNSLTPIIGRIFLYFNNYIDKTAQTLANTADARKYDLHTPESRLIADIVMLLLLIYAFSVIFASCVKVTFFLKGNYNYLKFAPIPLVPIGIMFTDQLCKYGVKPYNIQIWIGMLCYVLLSFWAYVCLVSPPDSLFAICFQPHVPMISLVSDLPEIKESPEKPRTTAVFPEGKSSKSKELAAAGVKVDED